MQQHYMNIALIGK